MDVRWDLWVNFNTLFISNHEVSEGRTSSWQFSAAFLVTVSQSDGTILTAKLSTESNKGSPLLPLVKIRTTPLAPHYHQLDKKNLQYYQI
jgi:hypothetical protein